MTSFQLVEHGTSSEADSPASSFPSIDTPTSESESVDLPALLAETAALRKGSAASGARSRRSRLPDISPSLFTLRTLACSLLLLILVGLFVLLTVTVSSSPATPLRAGGDGARGSGYMGDGPAKSGPRTVRDRTHPFQGAPPVSPPRKGNRSEPASRRPLPPATLSLQQACATDIAAACAAAASRERLDCLLHRYYRARYAPEGENDELAGPHGGAVVVEFTPICWAWLEAREACAAVVHAAGPELCGGPDSRRAHARGVRSTRAHHNLRECLRKADPARLPPACADSAYYQSVKLFGQLREAEASRLQRHPPGY